MPSTTVGTIAPAAVVLAGERPGALYPLDAAGSGNASSVVGVGGIASSSSSSSSPLLLPLAGVPLLSYPLRALEASGVRRIIVVVNGDAAASKVSSWASKAYPSSSSNPLTVSVVAAPDDASTADALSLALPLLDASSTKTFLCVPGDLVSDASFGPAVLRHFVSGAGVTALLARAKASPAATSGGAGKAPRGADLVSVDRESSRLLFSSPSPRPPRLGEDASVATTTVRGAANGNGNGNGGAAANGSNGSGGEENSTVSQTAQLAPAPKPPRELRVPPLALAAFPNLEIRSDLVDVGCYVFDTEAVAAALEKGTARGGGSGREGGEGCSSSSFAGLSLREDVVPYLVRKQFSASSPHSSPHSAVEDLLAYPVEAAMRSRAGGSGSGDGGGGLERADSSSTATTTTTAATAKGKEGGSAAGTPNSSKNPPPSPSASPPPPALAAAAARRLAAAARRRALSRPARAFVLPKGALCLRAARGGAPSFLDAAREVAAAAASAEAAAAAAAAGDGGGEGEEGLHGGGGGEDSLSPPPSSFSPSSSLPPPPSSSSSLLSPDTFPTVHPTATVAPKAAVAAGCLLGAGTAVGDRASVKRSALGPRCRVARSAKVVGCALGEAVAVGEGATLQNCVVGSGAVVGARASLRECFVGPGVVLAEEFSAKEEVLVSAAGAAAAAARARGVGGGGGGGGGSGVAGGGGGVSGSHASDQFGFGSL